MENLTFNKNDTYNKKIIEKVHELKVLCKQENIPFFFAACVENSSNHSTYKLEMLSGAICDSKLSDDWISKFVDITRGFDAVPCNKHNEIDTADML